MVPGILDHGFSAVISTTDTALISGNHDTGVSSCGGCLEKRIRAPEGGALPKPSVELKREVSWMSCTMIPKPLFPPANASVPETSRLPWV